MPRCAAHRWHSTIQVRGPTFVPVLAHL